MRNTKRNRNFAVAVLFALAAFGANPGHAILITTDTNATSLATTLTSGSSGFTVLTATLSGFSTSSGTFTNAAGTYGIGPGIVISSGNVLDYNTGPNTTGSKTTSYATAATAAQEAILDPITGSLNHFDVTQLDIDFTTSTGSVFFQVVFGSEEWPEFVGSIFIDGFGLLLDGVNIAFVLGSPVNINHPAMAGILGTELDGVLAPGGNPLLTFSASGLSAGTHTLTFIVADSSDTILDTTAYIASLGGTAPAPEPGTLALLAAGLAGVGALRRRKVA